MSTRRHGMGHGILMALATTASICLLAGGAAADEEPLTLSLEDAVQLALENNREMQIAEAGVEAARARVGQARSAYFPTLSASASYTRLDEAPYMDISQFGDLFPARTGFGSEAALHEYLDGASGAVRQDGGSSKIYLGDDDVYTIGLSVRQPIFTGGAILSGHGAARHAARAEELRAARTEGHVRYDAASAYLGLIRAQAALEVMDEAVEEMRSHISDLESMFDAEVILESEVMRGRVQLSEMELARSRAKHGVDLAEASLGFVLGLGPDTEIEAAEVLEVQPFPERELESWERLAVEERADLRAADELVGAADDGVTRARSGYFPNVMAIGNYMWDRPNRQYEPEFYGHWTVTLALEMSIFDWGLTGNRVKEARAGLIQAQRGHEMLHDAVRLEVRQAFLEREEALDRLSIAEGAILQAEESLRVTRLNFKNGQATNSDVLSAETALTRAQMNRVDALAGLRLAEARLELAASETVAGGNAR